MLFSLKAFPLALDDIQLAFDMGYPDGKKFVPYHYIVMLVNLEFVPYQFIADWALHPRSCVQVVRPQGKVHVALQEDEGGESSLIVLIFPPTFGLNLLWMSLFAQFTPKTSKPPNPSLLSGNIFTITAIFCWIVAFVLRLRLPTSLLWSIWTRPRSWTKTRSSSCRKRSFRFAQKMVMKTNVFSKKIEF